MFCKVDGECVFEEFAMWKNIWKKMNKTILTTAVTMVLVLLFVLLTGQKKASPDNPMDEADANASRMYYISSTLAIDESLFEGMQNANISSGNGKSGSPESMELPKENEETKEQEQQEEELTEAELAENIQEETKEIPPISESLLELIQKMDETQDTQNNDSENDKESENGDNGVQTDDTESEGDPAPGSTGQQTALSPEASSELFTTSIVDGESVTDPAYYFTITLTAKGEAQKLISQSVTVNGVSKSFTNGDNVTLKEGANTIVVTLRFRDKNYNQIDAPTKSYTVYYVPENSYFLQVENADTGEVYTDGMHQDVTENTLNVKVYALKGNSITSVRFRLNNQVISEDREGIYHMVLKVGSNEIKVTAGTGQNQQVITFFMNYQPGVFTLTMESAAVTEKIQGNKFGNFTYAEYASETETFAFRISCSKNSGLEFIQSIAVTTHLGTTEMLHMADASGYIQCNLDSTQITEIKVICQDTEGAVQHYTWQIKYIRSGATPENKKPIIQVNLAEGEVLKTSPYILTLHGKDYLGKQLYPTQMQVYLNGQLVEYSGISGIAYEYILYLQEGENLLQIAATDMEQYRAVKEIPFTYEAVVENVNVSLQVDANVLGIGTFVQENLSVPSNTTIAQFLEERLIANGYMPSHLGSTTGDYYLQGISKPGILNGWYVSEERQNKLIEEGYGFSVPDDVNTLNEYDFSQGSGWMITLNGYFIGMGMGTRTVRDGDVIRVQFTLDIGYDIGVDPSGGIYG